LNNSCELFTIPTTILIIIFLIYRKYITLPKKRGYNISFQEFCKRAEKRKATDLEISNLAKKGLKLPEIPKDTRTLLSAVGIGDEKIVFS